MNNLPIELVNKIIMLNRPTYFYMFELKRSITPLLYMVELKRKFWKKTLNLIYLGFLEPTPNFFN